MRLWAHRRVCYWRRMWLRADWTFLAWIDWIVQYDPPNDVRDYVHRVGRTNRGRTEKNGKALLFMIAQEKAYLAELAKYNIEIKQFECPSRNKLANIQAQLEKITGSVYHLHVLAHKAYHAYVRKYGMRSGAMCCSSISATSQRALRWRRRPKCRCRGESRTSTRVSHSDCPPTHGRNTRRGTISKSNDPSRY